MPRIHLVTYATPRFRLRQMILGFSARLNGVADTITTWNAEKLLAAGFAECCKDIKLTERGSGFWAWKPFIIGAKLCQVEAGDIVFYCDVGRLPRFKLLDQAIKPFIQWMDEQGQDMMPGILIPWDGPASSWTKRDVFLETGLDTPSAHATCPIQASFSIWRAGQKSRELVGKWMDLCSKRQWVSDDPSKNGMPDLAGFRAHRHDQSLLTLCCLKENIHGLDIGSEQPNIDSRHPSQVSRLRFEECPQENRLFGSLLNAAVWPIEKIEERARRSIRFGKVINE